MGCNEQKLGSGLTELKKLYFHPFCQIYHEKHWQKQSKFTENCSSSKKYKSCVIPSISNTHSRNFQYNNNQNTVKHPQSVHTCKGCTGTLGTGAFCVGVSVVKNNISIELFLFFLSSGWYTALLVSGGPKSGEDHLLEIFGNVRNQKSYTP